MSEVTSILEHLENLKKSFVLHYDLNPQDDKDILNVIRICVDTFNQIINKVNEIAFKQYNYNDFFSILYQEILKLDSLMNITGINNKVYMPLIDISMCLVDINRFLDKEISVIKNKDLSEKSKQVLENIQNTSDMLVEQYKELELISSDYKHKEVQKIYENDSARFKKVAGRYEMAFYTLIFVFFLYFLGLKISFPDMNILSIKISFPNKLNGNLLTEFYIQKISLLILSTTLLAFLLKRSFMYRRLADDAYRTSKELIALPRYMKDLPQEMQDKVHFDLAYKYFGQGIHHESYTSGENLMHENIKANTEFLKAIKGSSSEEESKKDGEK